MKVGGNKGGEERPSAIKAKATRGAGRAQETGAAPASQSPARSGGSGESSGVATTTAASLDQASPTSSDAAAAREVTRRQAAVASTMTNPNVSFEDLSATEQAPLARGFGGNTQDPSAASEVEESNKRVADLVNANTDKTPDGYKKLAEQLKDMDPDMVIIALAELPPGEAQKVSDAFQARHPRFQTVYEDDEVADIQRELLEAQQQALDSITHLREANEALRSFPALMDDFNIHPELFIHSPVANISSEMRERMEKNPEIANLIMRSNEGITDGLLAGLKNPAFGNSVLSDLAGMSQFLEPELVQHLANGVVENRNLVGDMHTAVPLGDVIWTEDLPQKALPNGVKSLFDVSQLPPELGIEVANQLQRAGNTTGASEAVNLLSQSSNALATSVSDNVRAVEEANQNLFELISQWQGVMSPEQLEGAIAAYREQFPAYAELEAQGQLVIKTTDALLGLPEGLNSGDIPNSLEKLESQLLPVLQHTNSATMAVGDLLARDEGGNNSAPGLLEKVDELAGTLEDGANFADQMTRAAFNSTTSKMTAAFASGDTSAVSRYLDDLGRHGRFAGVNPHEINRLRDAFTDLQSATASGDPSRISAAESQFRARADALNHNPNLGSPSSAARGALHGLLGITGLIGSVASFDEAMEDSDLETKLQNFLGTAVGAGAVAESAANLAAYLRWAGTASPGGPVTPGFVQPLSKLTGGLGVILSGWQIKTALEDKDMEAVAIHAIQGVAGVAMMSGNPIAMGVGAAALLGTAGWSLVKGQIQKVQYSNRLENEHTEAFLRGGGVPDHAAEHLRNADENGVTVGPVIEQFALHQRVSEAEVLNWLYGLSDDKLSRVVEIMHDFNNGSTCEEMPRLLTRLLNLGYSPPDGVGPSSSPMPR